MPSQASNHLIRLIRSQTGVRERASLPQAAPEAWQLLDGSQVGESSQARLNSSKRQLEIRRCPRETYRRGSVSTDSSKPAGATEVRV